MHGIHVIDPMDSLFLFCSLDVVGKVVLGLEAISGSLLEVDWGDPLSSVALPFMFIMSLTS